jgi:uncharacterized integral membrane protein
MIEWIGWLATGVFTTSYFCRQPVALRRTQALAAALWIGYGISIKALPVIVANLVVATIALISSFQRRERSPENADRFKSPAAGGFPESDVKAAPLVQDV